MDEDNFGPSITEEDVHISVNTNSRVVVLKHMFTLRELEEDPTLLLDLKEDVREECETLGEVTNVVLYDVWLALSSLPSVSYPPISLTERARWRHHGEVQRPRERSSVRSGMSNVSRVTTPVLTKCKKMHGRFFAGRKIEASLWIGKQRFMRSGVAEDVEDTGGDEGEKQRLDAFAQWLLTEGD